MPKTPRQFLSDHEKSVCDWKTHAHNESQEDHPSDCEEGRRSKIKTTVGLFMRPK